MNRANYSIVTAECDEWQVVLRDVGPWDEYPTITNDAANVVLDLASRLDGRRLLYYDSDGELTELRYDGHTFLGYAYPSTFQPELPEISPEGGQLLKELFGHCGMLKEEPKREDG